MIVFELIKKNGVNFFLAKKLAVGIDLKSRLTTQIFASRKGIFSQVKKTLDKNLYYEKRLVLFLKQFFHVKGRKFIFKLPVRGQRTHTNSRTAKKVVIGY